MAEKENKNTPDVQDWNEVERAVFERRSVRKYREKQVPENLIRRILEAGRFAPSAGNSQPWKLIVVRDKEMIDEMERDVVRLCKVFKFFLDWRRPGLIGKIAWFYAQMSIRLMPNEMHPIPFGAISLIADGKLKVFHGAPTVLFILKDKRGAGSPDLDCGICGQNMVLTAYSLGLSTCWVGFSILLTYGLKWRRRLGIKFPYQLMEGICIGYPIGNPNGMIERETQEIDWYEHGKKKTVF